MNEWVGLVITIAIFIYLMLKNRPAQEQSEQEDKLKGFLKSVGEDMAAKKKPSPPPLLPPKPFKSILPPKKLLAVEKQQSIVSSYFEKGVQYDVIGKATPSRVHRILQNLKSKGDMVILQEIIGPPKCKRR
jgi:hypothetical protein